VRGLTRDHDVLRRLAQDDILHALDMQRGKDRRAGDVAAEAVAGLCIGVEIGLRGGQHDAAIRPAERGERRIDGIGHDPGRLDGDEIGQRAARLVGHIGRHGVDQPGRGRPVPVRARTETTDPGHAAASSAAVMAATRSDGAPCAARTPSTSALMSSGCGPVALASSTFASAESVWEI
jgi:hypothetical protein